MSEYVNYDGLKRYDELIKNVISVKTLIGSCSTAAETAAKVISVESGFKLLKGVRIGVKFTNSNTASNVTLNVNNTGAKSIYYNNAVYTETSNMICGYANRYVFYVYDGTNWVWDGYSNHDNTNTWKAANASQEGYVPKSTANKILRSDANGALYWGNDNNTTYSSKAAEANGTDVSLVTTGEKAIWNAKTSNTGTITGIKMNGVSKGTSGVVDLGTVITAHQNISGKVDKTTTVNGHALSGNVSVTKSDVGLSNVTNDSQVKRSEMGVASGVATLDSTGKVPSSQLPSYVDDVIEGYFYNSKFYKESTHTTEITGETGKIYVDLSTNKTYRWGGSAYAVISETLALGETSSTAYRGDRGKTAYTHSQTTSGNPHNVTKSDVGLGNVGNFKAVSTEASQGLTNTEKSNARANIGAGTSSFSGSYNDLTNKPTIPAAAANGTYTVKTLVGSTTTNVSDFTANQSSADDVTFVQGSNVTITPDATNRKITIAATNTKNTAGSTDSSSKLFLIGATEQSANPQTYSQDTAYVGTDGCLYSGGSKVAINSQVSAFGSNGIIDTHGEGTRAIILDSGNDLYALYDRGGSCTAYEVETSTTLTSATLTKTSTTVTTLSANLFSGLVGYNQSGVYSGEKFAVYDLILPSTLSYGSTFYWSFGASQWKPEKMRILIAKDSGDYIQKYTSDSCPTFGKADVSNSSTGYNRIRIVMSKYSRLSLLGVRNYNYTGQRTTFMNRTVDDHVYRNITPAKNSNWSLGGSNNYWKDLYITNINGVAVGSSPKFTDTTYSSKSAASGGTDVSLVTTGEKYVWNSKTSNTGTVTKVTAGTGLTGGNITTTGTIALATSGVTAGTYKRVTVDAYGRVTSGDNTDSDTKNTAGTTNKTGTKMFLAAATEQGANPQTYSNSNCYIGTDNCLYSGGNKVLTSETYTGTVTGVKVGTTSYNPSSGIVTIPAYPTTLPASDVSAWAKASTKPSYSYSEINYNPTEITSAGGAISIDGTNPLLVITISAAVSGITFSAIPENGHSCHLIITAASALSVAIAHGATMFTGYTSVCPEAADISLDITAGGYLELDLLRIGTKIYVRGV